MPHTKAELATEPVEGPLTKTSVLFAAALGEQDE